MLTDLNNVCEKKSRQDFDHEVGMKVLIDLSKAESPYKKEPWTITQVYTLYEWNYQGSKRRKIGKNKYPESKTIPRQCRG